MSLYASEINGIVESVWTSAMGFSVMEDDPFHLEFEKGTTYGGVVQITGAWDGMLALQCSNALARLATTELMGIPGDEVSESDIHDAVGELANMVGGNFKSLLPGECSLGLPVVLDGSGFRITLPGGVQVLRCAYKVQGEPLSVTVLSHAGAAVA